jgi:hypothetical protein
MGQSKLSVMKDGMRFFNSIIWKAHSNKPVRIQGLIGLAGIGFAALVALTLVMMRASGFTQLGPWGIVALFSAMVLGVAGVSLFSLGAMFNYLVALLQKTPVKQGLFGKPIFDPPLERHFWWLGLLGIGAGVAIAIAAIILAFNGWTAERLWLWMVASAMAALMECAIRRLGYHARPRRIEPA